MARLILEEAGARRAFRVNPGRLTIGSGEGCTLTLASPEVAEVHAELVVDAEGVTLHPRPGVLPPLLRGVPVKAPTRVPLGATIAIGAAKLTLSGEEAPQAAAGRAGAAQGAAAAVPRVQRTRRPTVKRGMPTWLLLLIIGGVLAAGVFAAKGFFEQMGEKSVVPEAVFAEAVVSFNSGTYQHALQKLALIEGEPISAELAARIRELEDKIAAKERAAEEAGHNMAGNEFLATQLQRFVDERLQGTPAPEKVRVFLLRCREFRERWPTHPEMDWVDRYEARFDGLVDLTRPPTFEEVAYQVETMTWAMPRDYAAAFEVLGEFLARAEYEERVKAEELLDELRTAREEYFLDRMQQAKYHWNKDEKGQAVEWLVQLVIKVGDEDMAQQAADELVILPGIEGWLAGYKRDRPDKFERLVAHPTVRAKARELGLLDEA